MFAPRVSVTYIQRPAQPKKKKEKKSKHVVLSVHFVDEIYDKKIFINELFFTDEN